LGVALDRELTYYVNQNNYDTANLGILQYRGRRNFRFQFLQVYRKSFCTFRQQFQRVIAFAVPVPNTRTLSIIYIPSKSLPISVPTNRISMGLAQQYRSYLLGGDPLSNISSSLARAACVTFAGETWYRLNLSPLRPGQLGVGPFDWHSVKALQALTSAKPGNTVPEYAKELEKRLTKIGLKVYEPKDTTKMSFTERLKKSRFPRAEYLKQVVL